MKPTILNKHRNLKLKRLIYFIILLLAGNYSNAQNFPSSCTSKDLTLLSADLPAPSNNRCVCSGDRQLILGVYNGTGSYRTSFALWGTLVRTDANGGTTTTTIFACAAGIQPKLANYLPATTIYIGGVFTTTVHVDCGETLDIVNMHLAWTSASPGETCEQLRANPETINPKCGTQELIHVGIGVAGTLTKTDASCTTNGTIKVVPYGGLSDYQVCLDGGSCQTVGGNTTATFNGVAPGAHTILITDNMGQPANARCSTSRSITILQPDQVNPPTFTITQPTCTVSSATVSITNYSSAVTYYLHAGTTTLTDASGIFSSVPAGTIYTLQGQKGGCAAFGDLVTITATKSTPSTPTGDPTQPTCSVATGTVSLTSDITGLSFSLNGGSFTNTTGIFNNLVAGDYGIRCKNSDGCISGTLTKTINTQPGTPTNPSLIVTEPSLCGSSTGSIQICSPHAGYTYKLYVGTTSSTILAVSGQPVIFSTIAAGSNPTVTAISNVGCESASSTCSDKVDPSTCTSNLNAARVNRTNSETVINIPGNDPSVTAFPNPYNDKIRFIVNAPESGNGSLELFNLLGQKVRTVYQGKIQEGTQTFEVFIPLLQRSSLIYVMRLNKKQVSGKLLNIK